MWPLLLVCTSWLWFSIYASLPKFLSCGLPSNINSLRGSRKLIGFSLFSSLFVAQERWFHSSNYTGAETGSYIFTFNMIKPKSFLLSPFYAATKSCHFYLEIIYFSFLSLPPDQGLISILSTFAVILSNLYSIWKFAKWLLIKGKIQEQRIFPKTTTDFFSGIWLPFQHSYVILPYVRLKPYTSSCKI